MLLIGGNLACLCTLLGTKWEPKINTPYILFLEDINEEPYEIDRMLYQLSHSKFFQKCQGVLLGHFTTAFKKIKNIEVLFSGWAKARKLFLAEGVEAGHHEKNHPILMGSKVSLQKGSSRNIIRLEGCQISLD